MNIEALMRDNGISSVSRFGPIERPDGSQLVAEQFTVILQGSTRPDQFGQAATVKAALADALERNRKDAA